MKHLISVAKAFSDPNRVRILAALRGGELCVCELVDALALSQSTLSTHLQVIRRAGLVDTRREGKWSYYAIAPEQAGLVDLLFSRFQAELGRDKTLLKDVRRSEKRLALRKEGACCVGTGRTGGGSC